MGPLGHSLAALAALVLAPLGLLALLLRPSLRHGWVQRLGGGSFSAPGAVWVHASSVGEARAAMALIEALRRSGHSVFVSVTTATGVEAVRRLLPDVVCIRAPVDHPWCVERALARIRPAVLVLVETELWPFIIAAAARRSIPVVVASGRLSDRSYPRYRRVRGLAAKTLAKISAVGARSVRDAERFVALGAAPERVTVTGDLKLEPPPPGAKPAPELERALSGAPVFVAGSTHAGEEETALAVLEACEQRGLRPVAVVAPRHPERVPDVEQQLLGSGRRVVRRSALAPLGEEAGVLEVLEPGSILLLDSVGELAGLYGLAATAFVGGSLAPVGGHNLLEPLLAGCPVLFGPHVEEMRMQAEVAVASGAGLEVADGAELARRAADWLADAEQTRQRGQRAAEEIGRMGGSARRAVAMIERVMAGEDAKLDRPPESDAGQEGRAEPAPAGPAPADATRRRRR